MNIQALLSPFTTIRKLSYSMFVIPSSSLVIPNSSLVIPSSSLIIYIDSMCFFFVLFWPWHVYRKKNWLFPQVRRTTVKNGTVCSEGITVICAKVGKNYLKKELFVTNLLNDTG
jgi:hypothetical protein